MHLWPSLRIRDSFKQSYLTKFDRNRSRSLHRMKASSSHQANDNKTPLLSDNNKEAEKGAAAEESDQPPSTSNLTAGVAFAQDLVLILSCCFCCGACRDEEEK